jgi:hypothetical protein
MISIIEEARLLSSLKEAKPTYESWVVVRTDIVV